MNKTSEVNRELGDDGNENREAKSEERENRLSLIAHRIEGGKTMSKLMKRAVAGLVGVVGLVLGGWMVERAHAYSDTISTNNVTALTVRFTPNADRGVEISSGGVVLNLGTVDAGISTKTVSPATVTILGTMASTELNMISSVTASGKSFEFDDDPTTVGTDLIGAWVLFSSVTYSGVPGDTDFEVYNATVTQSMGTSWPNGSGTRVGGQGGDGTRFELVNTNMDAMTAGTRRGMWVRFKMPPTFDTVTGDQDVTFQLNIVAPPY